eukprot:439946-Rhodomonas_salina.3
MFCHASTQLTGTSIRFGQYRRAYQSTSHSTSISMSWSWLDTSSVPRAGPGYADVSTARRIVVWVE